MRKRWLSETKAQERSNEAKRKAQTEAKKYADTLRGRMRDAVQSVNDALEQAQQNFDGYRDSLAEAINSSVSLADAMRTQESAESDLQAALKDRAEAYTALNKLNPIDDAEAYAEALERVAAAESTVSTAQLARADADYGKVFRKQIADAQAFATNLQELVNAGLSQAGLSQLLSLGPVAGKQVTDHMIAVPNGAAVQELNQQLAGLAGVGQNLGVTGANAFFGGALLNAQNNATAVNQYSITVHAGLVSNPAQVGRDIIEAIKKAEKVSGKVFADA